MKNSIVAALFATSLLSSCATASKDIGANYVSPIHYQTYKCEQIENEQKSILSRVDRLGVGLDRASSNDKAITGVGMVVFWPALFALGGTKEQQAEYSQLKGEFVALEQAATLKECQSNGAPIK